MNFTESIRYKYPLSETSNVIDLGAYHGTFSAEISRLYDCNVWAYEPIKRFYDIAKERLKPFHKVALLNAGVACQEGFELFGIKGDMTGAFTGSEENEVVKLIAFEDVLPDSTVDLLKINIEGGEFALLDYIIANGLHSRLRNIQVQFHGNIPNAQERWKSIHDALLKTHHVTYLFPFCWENYELNQ